MTEQQVAELINLVFSGVIGMWILLTINGLVLIAILGQLRRKPPCGTY